MKNPKSNVSFVNLESDQMGRLLCTSVKTTDQTFIICNMYVPNSDDPQFFSKAINVIENMVATDGSDATIIGGDFNLVFDTSIDRNESLYNHKKMMEVLKEYVQHSNLCAIWRLLHPENILGTSGTGTITQAAQE